MVNIATKGPNFSVSSMISQKNENFHIFISKISSSSEYPSLAITLTFYFVYKSNCPGVPDILLSFPLGTSQKS